VGHSRGGFPARMSRPRRRTGWQRGTGGTTSTALSSTGAQFVGNAVSVLEDGFTVVRTRGYYQVHLTLATAVNNGFLGAFGIAIASTAAVAAGIGSVPTPLTEQTWEGWLYWSAFAVKGITATTADGVNALAHYTKEIIDSKAMRKIGSDMSLYAAVDVVEGGVSTAELFHDSRMLFKLP